MNLTMKQLDVLAIFVEHTVIDVHRESVDIRTVLALWRKNLIQPIPTAPCEFILLGHGKNLFLELTRG